MHTIYELDLIERFKKAGYAKKLGKEFNKNNVKSVKTLLLCNGYVGNKVSNIYPTMMGVCPIRVTLISNGNRTKVVFVKNAHLAKNKEVKALLTTLDDIVKNTIDLTIDRYMQDAYADDDDSTDGH